MVNVDKYIICHITLILSVKVISEEFQEQLLGVLHEGYQL